MSRQTTLLASLLALPFALAACGQQAGQCSAGGACDTGLICSNGECVADPGDPLSAASVVTVSPASQTVQATVGEAPAAASFTLTNSDTVDHPVHLACTGAGATPAESTVTVQPKASETSSIDLAAPTSAGTQTATCTGSSSSGKTTWVTFTITVVASSGSGGGSGGGSGVTLSLVAEPSGGFSSVYSAINAATSTIDLVMYELVDTTVTSDLIAAGKRGVKVRAILDTNNESGPNSTAYSALSGATNVSVVWANKSFSVTHEKSMVVDAAVSGKALACIWTANLVSKDYSDTRDFLLYENDAVDIAAMETTFNSDFSNGGGATYSPSGYTPPTGDHLLWSPTNAQSGLLAIINNAQHTLLLDEEEMEDTALANALEARAKAGVSVKIALTTGETESNLLSALKTAGVQIAEYPGTGTELYIHAKAIVADLGYSNEAAYLGSINFSNASLTSDRELGLVFTDAISSSAKSAIAALAATLQADVACSSDSSCTMY